MAASASETARHGKPISVTFTNEFADLVGAIERNLTGSPGDRRQKALAIVATMIGGIAVARATAKANLFGVSSATSDPRQKRATKKARVKAQSERSE